jgi:hypothetical protein
MHRLEFTMPKKSPLSSLLLLGAVSLSVGLAQGCAADGASTSDESDVLAQTVNPRPRDEGTTPTTPTGPTVTPTGRDTPTTPPTTGPTVTPTGPTVTPTGPTITPTGRDENPTTPTTGPIVGNSSRIRTSGTGCAAGSVTSQLSSDGLTATLKLGQFALDVDGQATAAADCLINIRQRDLSYQYSVVQVYIDGYAYLDGTSHGTVLGRYWGGGQAEPGWAAARTAGLKGPRDWDWAFVDDVVEADRSWSVCGTGEVNVAASVRLDNGGTSTSVGYINAENVVVKLAARPCTRS